MNKEFKGDVVRAWGFTSFHPSQRLGKFMGYRWKGHPLTRGELWGVSEKVLWGIRVIVKKRGEVLLPTI